MPLIDNIKKVMVIGSGPIVIGQAAEFDYSGTQGCKAIREEGIEVVLINSNPATIMTDKESADAVYIEPLTVEFAEKIIKKERPDGIISGLGGQTGLNLTVQLYKKGILDKYGVKVLGTSIESIIKGEDREEFRDFMNKIGEPIIDSIIVENIEEGLNAGRKLGFPLIIRPAYTLGGTGGGIVNDSSEFLEKLTLGLKLSPVNQVLLEKSIYGWKEIEYEVMRDKNGNLITVCNMENIDPVGIHTGDSIVVAPSQTLSDVEYQMLRNSSLKIINEIGIVGGCNVQFALNPKSMEYAVIEINPRVSRSSALASKATGYPIAKVSTKLALGYTLDEILNDVTGKTYASFEPSLDYIVIKIPKWPFEKFVGVDKTLGTKMTATGEIMAIGANFEAALMKGIRSLEIGQYSLEMEKLKNVDIKVLREVIKTPYDERLFAIAELIRRKYSIERLCEITAIDRFFIEKVKNLVDMEENLKEMKIKDMSSDIFLNLKKRGFSDKGIAKFLKSNPEDVYNLRKLYGIVPSYKIVDTCGGEFDAVSPYYYSTYEQYDEVEVSEKEKVIVIGSGPIRIGQGIEFDYASVHCALSLSRMGYETIIINNNPETVSTDFNVSDKLYFEPITEEDVLNIVEKENPIGVIIQFGGQTSIKLAQFLDMKGIKILGTGYDGIFSAEDRDEFNKAIDKLSISQPKGKCVYSVSQGIESAKMLDYPVIVRPSYVLGGAGMEITWNENELTKYLKLGFSRDKKNPILIDKYLLGKELEIDGIYDGEDILIPGIMEHIERAGVHSGDSMTLYPDVNVSDKIKEEILQISKSISEELGILGIVNIQFVLSKGKLYVIEVNPRASRTVPYLSKISGVRIVDVATRVMMGEKLKDMDYGTGIYKKPERFSIKIPVFSTEKLANAEMSLGPEMKSTGEVLGVSEDLYEAIYKGFIAGGFKFTSKNKKYLATIKDSDKDEFLHISKKLNDLGYEAYATEGTYEFLKINDISTIKVEKLENESEEILNLIQNGNVDFVVNTPTLGNNSKKDGFKIRRVAVENGIDIFTSLDTISLFSDILVKKITLENVDVFSI